MEKKERKLILFTIIPLLILLLLPARFIFPAAKAESAQDFNALSYVVAGGMEKGWRAEYDLGDIVTPDVPAGTKLLLKYPDGSIAKDSAAPGAVTLDAAGHWTAVYTKNGKPVTREFRFLVNAGNYEIELPFNGAGIPTLIEKGETFTLPKASVIYTDKRDEIRTLNDPDITVTVSTAYSAPVKFSYTADSAVRKIIAPPSGEILISYSFGESVKSVIQKNYIVTVADNINVNISPVLRVSMISAYFPLMTKVTLPVAWASDDQDGNVKVEISAKAPDGSFNVYTVKESMLDEDTYYIADKFKDPADKDNYYARKSEGNPNKAVFDNKRNMTFYPDQTGVYEITYTATNDCGKTDSKIFRIQCEDTREPYIKIDSRCIPRQWTNDVLIKLDENGYEKTCTAAADPGQLRFYFPKPAFIDNICLEKDILNKPGNVSISLRKGAIELDVMTYTDGAYISDKAGTGQMIFEDENRFFIPADKLEADADYAIMYFVSDNAVPARSSSAAYVVRIVSRLKDVSRPYISFNNIANTIKTGSSFTKPVIKIDDDSDTWTQETRYLLVNSVTKDEADFTGIKDLFYEDTVDKFNLAALQKIRPGAGFGTGANQFDKIEIRVSAADAVGNESREARTINIIDTESAAPAPLFETVAYGDGITAAANDGYIELKSAGTGGKFEYGSGIVIKDIKIRQAGKDPFLGYEFTVRNAAGYITGITETTSWIDTANADNTFLYIDEFSFTPDKSGRYTVTLSVFNASNASRSVNFTFEIEKSGGTIMPISSAAPMASIIKEIPVILEYDRIIELPNFAVMDSDGEPLVELNDKGFNTYQYKRTIKGPHYSLQGFELLAYETGEYTITIKAENPTLQSYKGFFEVNDTVGPAIRLTGVLPVISFGMDRDVYLPGMMVSDAAGIDTRYLNQSVMITGGGTSEYAKKITREDYPEKIAENPSLEGMYFFTPFAVNGITESKYRVTYSAADNNGQSVSLSFYISVSVRHAETSALFIVPVSFGVTSGSGSLSAAVENAFIQSGAEVADNKSVVFKANPSNGFRVKAWKLNGMVIEGNTSDTYVLTDFEGEAVVTVEFELIPPESKKPGMGCGRFRNTPGIIGALLALALVLALRKKRI